MGLLDGQIAIITGAASPRGLGKATAKLFVEHGAKVAILDLDEGQAEEAAADLGAGHIGLACDVTRKEDCDRAVAVILEAYGQIDILVNNAGITQPLKIMEIRHENYDAVLDVNLLGTLNMSQAVIPHMRERQSGKLVNMSSVSAQRGGGIFGGPHYSAAKAGVLGLTKAMARELAPDGIRANAICPGFIATDITAGKLTPEMKVQILAGIPMGRAGEASDVAGCALFLASDLSAYVTGSEVDVNGGSLIH
ncbi:MULTISPECIES: SDR family NAD(P)-dependent oxidoreductase [Roseobacteraceae]|jgi:NAD(P)-dependent dehydrogenase (short-subunit alcohol dehydrogenase family)|uniref:SDR family NAD(P)-dependent oxidoreductase n=1 Tax=Roseobacteraceae TaxID=2854170 RepID=UPI001935928B|nr:SDR family NAD(P)-dependent oxidoreductase [Roseovarius sp. 10]MBE1290556.1 glucose 1-dehydrogenase [Paracoccaceae bacterium]MBF9024579.1 glucose 1-dehydrogenase [Rhodobacterales bacterium HKCCD6035]MBF9053592.1 glucose 1-dehydrogenase [Rhodobacterales bacterium LSUCC1028]MBF9055498.1 glucose 1-dehydrogenase [Rhodobacterales bacterium HKCCA1065]QPI86413.1 SDR family oxidoreductase [Rhodobacterales bacterium HKCCA1288]